MSRSLEAEIRTRRKKIRIGPWLLFLLFLASASAVVSYWWSQRELPNTERASPVYTASPQPIMLNGDWTGYHALGEGEGLLIPLELGRQLMADGIYYEEETDSVVLTTKTKVLHFKVGAVDATMNQKPFALQFAAVKEQDAVYLPLAPLEELFGFQAEIDGTTGIVTLLYPNQALQPAQIAPMREEPAALREGPATSFPIVEDMAAGDALRIWGESEGWYRVQSASGHVGFLSKPDAVLLSATTVPALEEPEPFVAWQLTGKRLNLTWEAVYNNRPDPNKIGELPGVNVVSPTWFELVDGNGTIRSKADAAYTQYYRSKGIQVWALFSNGFEPEQTEQALASYETRLSMIQQLLAYAHTFKLQGINIDFENVKTSDKDNLVQFVREFTPLAHEQNLVVSIDVTGKSNSEFWSLFLDRARLGEVVDYMMVMAYDEHWASSPKAGSVSSLGWAENTIRRILVEDKVPPEKLVLGVPLYTRVWTETPDGNGGVKVSSKALGMKAVSDLIAQKKLTPVYAADAGQNYVEYKEGEQTFKIWIEDAVSMEARMNLAKKYNLAGVASWARVFASDSIWSVMDQHLQSRP